MQHESQRCPLIGPSSSVHSEFHFLQCFLGKGVKGSGEERV